MKDIIVIVVATIFTFSVLLYINQTNLVNVHEIDKEVLDLSVPVSGTIDTEYLRTRIVLPNEQ